METSGKETRIKRSRQFLDGMLGLQTFRIMLHSSAQWEIRTTKFQ